MKRCKTIFARNTAFIVPVLADTQSFIKSPENTGASLSRLHLKIYSVWQGAYIDVLPAAPDSNKNIS